MILEIIKHLSSIVCSILAIFSIIELKKIIKIYYTSKNMDDLSIRSKISELQSKIEDHYRDYSYANEAMHKELTIELLHLSALIIQVPNKDRESTKKGYSRPRTKEEKEAASLKRKEWWANKRREQQYIVPGISPELLGPVTESRQQPVDPTPSA